MEDIRGDFPDAHRALMGNEFLLLDSAEVNLKEIQEKYGVIAIVKAQSCLFSAYLYTGKEEEQPELLKEVFSQW